MPRNVTTIVEELIALEPSLREHRAALERNIQVLLESKPDTRFSAAFKKQLLGDLRARFVTEQPYSSFPLLRMWQKFSLAGGGAVLGALLVFVLAQQNVLPTTQDLAQEESSGTMGMYADDRMNPPGAPTPSGNPVRSQGGGGSPEMMDSKMMVAPGMGGGGDMRIMPYNPVSVDFLYEGDITLPEGNVNVLKRKMGGSLGGSSILNNTFVSSLVNLSSVSGLGVQSVSLIQGGNEPWSVYVDFQQGTIGINKNINYANRPDANCRDQACFDRFRMREGDMPEDSAVIATANRALGQFSIDTADYGTPFVADQWQYWLAATENKADYYFPEQLTVTYPYLINGKPVYDEWGTPTGLSVSVDIRSNTATSIWGLQTMEFDTTSEAPVTDDAKVREILKQGGMHAWRDPSAKVVEANLKTPTEGYAMVYRWDEGSQTGDNYLVPALIFPVESIPMEANMHKSNVVIPLADEFLVNQKQDGMPMPVEPLMRDLGVEDIKE